MNKARKKDASFYDDDGCCAHTQVTPMTDPENDNMGKEK